MRKSALWCKLKLVSLRISENLNKVQVKTEVVDTNISKYKDK